MTRVAVIDYGMGNRRSVEKALEHVGAAVVVTREPAVIAAAEGIVLPGVGAFPRAMANLRELGLDVQLSDRVAAGIPLLGICLGMQLLFEASSEIEPTAGLGLIPGEVARLRADGHRIPHIGWNEVSFTRESPLTAGLGARAPFYHVHSYACHPSDATDVLASTEYGERFATVVGRGRVFGVQFHPEKSSAAGLRMLGNFAACCAAPARAAAPAAAPVGA